MATDFGSYEWPPAGSGAGGGVSSLNSITGAVTLVAGTGISITPSGSNITITNTGSSPTGTPDTISGFDDSGNLYSTPWGVDANGQVTGNFTGTLPLTSVTSLQIFPTISTALSGGYEGIIVGADFTSTMSFMSSFNAENTFDTGFNNSGSIGVYQDQSQFNSGAITGNYDSFGAFPALSGTISGYTGFIAAPASTGAGFNSFVGFSFNPVFNSGYTNSGGTIGFSDGTNFNTGTSSSYHSSLQLSPNFAIGSTIGSVQGASISPSVNGTLTGSLTGIQIHPTSSAPIGGDAQGITITMADITDSNPQGVMGLSSDGRININAQTTLVSAQGFQIGNRVESLFHVPPGSPVTGTDSLGNDFAGDLSAEDNIALGPIGLGWASVGFIADMSVAVGKTVDAVDVFVPAVALPDPGYTTGGTVTNMSMIRTFAPLAQGGTLSIVNLYGFHLDNSFGDFATAAVNSWGLFVEGSTLHNHFDGLVDMSFLQLNGSTSGTISHTAAAVTTNHTLTWPATQGAASTTLTNDGAGNLSWAASGSGANTSLSNLTTTSINQDLIPAGNDAHNLGSQTHEWQLLYCAGTVDPSGTVSIGFDSRTMVDASGGSSLLWDSRQLLSASGSTNISWSNNTAFEFRKHVKSTQSGTVTATPNANAGTGATSTVSNATDVAGKLELVTGTLSLAAGAQVTVGFATAYTAGIPPIVMLTPNNATAASAAVVAYVTSTINDFTVNFVSASLGGQTYDWFYQVIETQ